MAICETCGNDYDKTFQVVHNGKADSFECAIHAPASTCAHCGIRIVGLGLEEAGTFFCEHCAEGEGVHGLRDRVCSLSNLRRPFDARVFRFPGEAK
jgi:hypothetical protein